MKNPNPSALSSNVSPSKSLPVARILARFDLNLIGQATGDDVCARLEGSTFPFDDVLQHSGACWNKDTQSWTFRNSFTLEKFVNTLQGRQTMATNELAEDSRAFSNVDELETPLEQFLVLGPNALKNEDLLELLLSFDSYLADPRAMSRHLFSEFGSLGAVLAGETLRLTKLNDVTPRIRGLLGAVQLIIERVLHEPLSSNPVIGSQQALIDYLKGRLQHRQREELLVLYLDKKNRLIKSENVQGSTDHVQLYPREVAAKALELFSSATIIAHNHPGGDTTPSKSDVQTTTKLKNALDALDIELYDHVIVGSHSVFSFKASGLI